MTGSEEAFWPRSARGPSRCPPPSAARVGPLEHRCPTEDTRALRAVALDEVGVGALDRLPGHERLVVLDRDPDVARRRRRQRASRRCACAHSGCARASARSCAGAARPRARVDRGERVGFGAQRGAAGQQRRAGVVEQRAAVRAAHEVGADELRAGLAAHLQVRRGRSRTSSRPARPRCRRPAQTSPRPSALSGDGRPPPRRRRRLRAPLRVPPQPRQDRRVARARAPAPARGRAASTSPVSSASTTRSRNSSSKPARYAAVAVQQQLAGVGQQVVGQRALAIGPAAAVDLGDLLDPRREHLAVALVGSPRNANRSLPRSGSSRSRASSASPALPGGGDGRRPPRGLGRSADRRRVARLLEPPPQRRRARPRRAASPRSAATRPAPPARPPPGARACAP